MGVAFVPEINFERLAPMVLYPTVQAQCSLSSQRIKLTNDTSKVKSLYML